MRPARHPALPTAPLLVGALLALLPCAARAQGVSLAVAPNPDLVAQGSTFELDLQVPVAGAAFNGFHAVVAYDTTALRFVQAVPLSAQLGCLLDGTCSAACGTTFHVFQAAGDTLVIDVSLLCDQVHLTGPGQVYKLRFTASDSAQVTWVRLRDVTVYDAGIAVTPVATADGRVIIGFPAGVGGGALPSAWRLAAAPNPARGAVALSIVAPAEGVQALDVLDLSGRVVRHLAAGWQPRGARSLAWDGAGADGARLPAGVYLVRLRAGHEVATTRVTLVR